MSRIDKVLIIFSILVLTFIVLMTESCGRKIVKYCLKHEDCKKNEMCHYPMYPEFNVETGYCVKR